MFNKLVQISLCFIILVVPLIFGCSTDNNEPMPTSTRPYDGMLSSLLDEEGLPSNNLREFQANTTAIYFTIWVALGCCDFCGINWTYEGKVIDQDFVPKHDTDVYTGYFTASLLLPEDGFLPGNYSVYSSQSLEAIHFVITP
jgi:hypothetical protein